jgi:hypothetical protein
VSAVPGRAGVVTVIPLRDGPWHLAVLDRVVPCDTPGCQRHPFALFRWLHVDGRVACGVCRFADTRRVPERREPTPVGLPDEVDGQLSIGLP